MNDDDREQQDIDEQLDALVAFKNQNPSNKELYELGGILAGHIVMLEMTLAWLIAKENLTANFGQWSNIIEGM